MKLYITLLYAHSIRRKYFNLFGPKRHYTEVIGISVDSESEYLLAYDQSYRFGNKDEYNYPESYAQMPGLTSPKWAPKADILTRLRRVFVGVEGDATIVTSGDPIEASLINSLLIEAGLGSNIHWFSINQKIYNAAMWLPDEAYGPSSDFTIFILDPKQRSEMEFRKRMFISNTRIEWALRMYISNARLEHKTSAMRILDEAIDQAMQSEISRMLLPKEPDAIWESGMDFKMNAVFPDSRADMQKMEDEWDRQFLLGGEEPKPHNP